MERVASVNTKENHNPSNSVRQSLKSKKSFETGNNLRSSTQDLFPTTCYVIRPQSKQQSEAWQLSGVNSYFEVSRPASKQDFRKARAGRPETSKGVRDYDKFRKSSKDYLVRPTQRKEDLRCCYHERTSREFEEPFQIVINERKQKKVCNDELRSKFETDLDSEFLGLFAN